MKKLYYLFTMLLLPLSILAEPPTAPSSNLTGNYVEGNSFYATVTTGNGSSRLFIIKAGSPVTAVPQNGNTFLANGIFGLGQQIATDEYVVSNSTSRGVGLTNLSPNTEYYFAVFEYNGSGASTEYLTIPFLSGSISTLSRPTQQSTGITFSEITGNNMKLNWSPGDGDRRIVIARGGGPVNANPVDLTAYYANPRVEYRGSNSGAVIGDNNFVVYRGAGNEVSLSDMNPETNYHFAIFEYNGNSAPVYLSTSPLRGVGLTLPAPTIPASNIEINQVEANNFRIRWDAGNGTRHLVVVREGAPVTAIPQKNVSYGANSDFELAPEIAPGQKVMYDNVNTTELLRNLEAGKTYHIAIFTYSGSGSSIGYLTTNFPSVSQQTKAVPSVNTSNISSTQVSAYDADLTFTAGNGASRIIVMKKDNPVDFVPDQYKSYNFNKEFGSTYGNAGNGNYVVYKGADEAANVTLQPNTTYHVAAYEFNGNFNPAYNISNVATYSFTTDLPPSPTMPATDFIYVAKEGNSLQVRFTKGNGDRRIIIVRKGIAVTATPQNGIQYTTANSNFTLAPDLAPGQKIVYDGTGIGTNITGLEIGTTYHLQVVEYNGSGVISNYLSSSVLAGSVSTLTAPVTAASNITFEQVTQEQINIFFKKGSGARRLILARKNAPVTEEPADLMAYNGSVYFGSGSTIGQSSVILSSQGSVSSGDILTTVIYRLEAGATYYFKIFEYDGSSGPVYKKDNPAEGSFFIPYEPLTPSTNLRSTGEEGNEFLLQWTKGGGEKRVIVAREAQPVDVVPQDGVDYDANEDFSTAPEIAPGQRVIYDGTGVVARPKGLEIGTTYYFKIFEYGGVGASTNYLTTAFDVTSATTRSTPTVQASAVAVSNITLTTANISWTNGDGERRIVVAKSGSPVSQDPIDKVAYNPNSFGNGTNLGDGNYVVYKNITNNFTMSQLQSGTTYHLAVYEMNGNTGPAILRPGATASFTTEGPPRQNSVVLAATEVSSADVRINYTIGSGQKRIVIMRKDDPVNVEPTNNKKYVQNSFFSAGEELGTGNYIVYDGVESSIVVTGLEPLTTYHYTIFEYNAFGGGNVISYLRPSTATGSITTLGALPITWQSFSGTLEKNTAILNWETGSEHNNSYFIIECSTNGLNFTAVGKVQSKGNASNTQAYSYKDPLSVALSQSGALIYYRLRQVDMDGKFTLSSVLKLQGAEQKVALVYPNPVRKGTQPGISISNARIAQAILYNASGQVVLQQKLRGGYNSLKLGTTPTGIYLLKIVYQDGSTKANRIIIK